MDPIFQDFLDATDDHLFSTQPSWLFKQDTPHTYPNNATVLDWEHSIGTKLIDDSMEALGDYYVQLLLDIHEVDLLMNMIGVIQKYLMKSNVY